MILRRILLVEDNPTTRKTICFALEKRGHEVLQAADGNAALRLMEAYAPDLVLQDLSLSDVDGFSLISRLRECARREIRVLALSGFLSDAEEARVSAMGFDDILIKPIEPGRLVAVVEAHLRAPTVRSDHFGKGLRIVVADDDSIQLRLTRFQLEKVGFAVETAPDGSQALALAKRLAPDAIVADVLMPVLDGFGLALAARQERSLESVPLLLVTSSYVEDSDRDLARRAGANDLVLRTPDHHEVVQALRGLLTAPPVAPARPAGSALPDLEQERSRRVVRQLERQMSINAALARRCSVLASELTVLAGISGAMLEHQNFETALDEALAACFDAGGISMGALYLIDAAGILRARPLGGTAPWLSDQLASFFGHEALLRQIMTSGDATALPSSDLPKEATGDLLRKCNATSAMVLPLVDRQKPLGALFVVTDTRDLELEDSLSFVQGLANQITQALALANAFSEKEAAERDAKEQATLLRLILESIAEGVVVADSRGRFVLCNQAARKLIPTGPFDVPLEDWPRRHRIFLSDQTSLFPADRFPLARATRGESVDEVEFVVRPDEGPPRWLQVTGRPLVAEAQEPRGGVMVFRDVSEQRRQEQAKTSFLALAAHELRTPITAIKLLVLSIQKRIAKNLPVDESAFARLDRVIGRTEALVRDVGDAVRLEEGVGLSVTLRQIDFARLVVTALRNQEDAMLVTDRGQTAHSFEVMGVDAVCFAQGDPTRLGQVVGIVLHNAVKYSPYGGRIRVSLTRRDGSYRLSVSDEGIGIPQADLASVTRRYFRASNASPSNFPGMGLGLAFAKEIVERHGGRLEVASELGKGTIVTIVIPEVPVVMEEDGSRSHS
jgi:signal transduction histidine kinase/DNA-binding response OmpR family regulator